jgi:hypothetical protein
MKFYLVNNSQHQPVQTFGSVDEAKRHIAALRETYDENFYVVELTVVFSTEGEKNGR